MNSHEQSSPRSKRGVSAISPLTDIGVVGFEPTTAALSAPCSSQRASHRGLKFAEAGFEPAPWRLMRPLPCQLGDPALVHEERLSLPRRLRATRLQRACFNICILMRIGCQGWIRTNNPRSNSALHDRSCCLASEHPGSSREHRKTRGYANLLRKPLGASKRRCRQDPLALP